jgi:hypothetical protein
MLANLVASLVVLQNVDRRCQRRRLAVAIPVLAPAPAFMGVETHSFQFAAAAGTAEQNTRFTWSAGRHEVFEHTGRHRPFDTMNIGDEDGFGRSARVYG